MLELHGITAGYGHFTALWDVSLRVAEGEAVAVVGPNGAGKTTLFKMIQGLETPDSGKIKVGETVKISYVDQSRANIDPKKTLWAVANCVNSSGLV